MCVCIRGMRACLQGFGLKSKKHHRTNHLSWALSLAFFLPRTLPFAFHPRTHGRTDMHTHSDAFFVVQITVPLVIGVTVAGAEVGAADADLGKIIKKIESVSRTYACIHVRTHTDARTHSYTHTHTPLALTTSIRVIILICPFAPGPNTRAARRTSLRWMIRRSSL